MSRPDPARIVPRADPPRPSARRFDADLTTAELVTRARSGDRWATEVLFRRHLESATMLATRLMARRCDAEDIVQDAFAEALTSLGKLRDPGAFGGWLGRIVVTRCRRGLWRRKVAKLMTLDRGIDDSTLEQLACGRASPETLTELRIVDDVLEELPAQQRIAWLLRHVEREPLAAIAELTGASLATVKRRIHAAEVTLRGRLERGRS